MVRRGGAELSGGRVRRRLKRKGGNIFDDVLGTVGHAADTAGKLLPLAGLFGLGVKRKQRHRGGRVRRLPRARGLF